MARIPNNTAEYGNFPKDLKDGHHIHIQKPGEKNELAQNYSRIII